MSSTTGDSQADFSKYVAASTQVIEELKREVAELREESRQIRSLFNHAEGRLMMLAAENKQLGEEVKRIAMSPAGAAGVAVPGLPPPSPASLLPRQLRKDIVAFVKTHYEAIRARKESAKETGEKFSRLYDILFDELCAEKMLLIAPEIKSTARAALIEAVNNRQTMERRKRVRS